LDTGIPLTKEQQAAAQKFINRLPESDREPLMKTKGSGLHS
jgi:hypothetical protein